MEILSDKKVVTRKEHECDLCFRNIPKGTTMRVSVVADGGSIRRNYQCETCLKYWDKYLHNEDLELSGIPIYGEDKTEWEEIRKEVEYNGKNN